MPWMWRYFRNVFLDDRNRILLRLTQVTFLNQFFEVIIEFYPEYKFSSSGSACFDSLDVPDVSVSDISASVFLELES